MSDLFESPKKLEPWLINWNFLNHTPQCTMSAVHNVFHISQLKQCHRVPADAVDLESLDLQPGLTYEEYPIDILDRDERRVKRSMVKFVKIQWSNHSEDEATWEREDR